MLNLYKESRTATRIIVTPVFDQIKNLSTGSRESSLPGSNLREITQDKFRLGEGLRVWGQGFRV